jgi:GNAT superfamily N-acetyltransferase
VAQSGDDVTTAANSVHLREARLEDITAVQALCALAEVPLEQQIMTAIAEGSAGALLRVGREQGVETFLAESAAVLASKSESSLLNLFVGLTHVLVAEHRNAGVVGTALVFPPAGVVLNRVHVMQQMGAPFSSQVDVILAGALRITRVKAVAVDAGHRRGGLGTRLVDVGIAPFVDLGYSMIYGIMPPRTGLKEFYSRRGFTVMQPGEPLSLSGFGLPVEVYAEPSDSYFVRHL